MPLGEHSSPIATLKNLTQGVWPLVSGQRLPACQAIGLAAQGQASDLTVASRAGQPTSEARLATGQSLANYTSQSIGQRLGQQSGQWCWP